LSKTPEFGHNRRRRSKTKTGGGKSMGGLEEESSFKRKRHGKGINRGKGGSPTEVREAFRNWENGSAWKEIERAGY